MSKPQTYDDILEKMFGNREALIKALHFYNGRANTKEMRERGGIARGSIYNLLDEMENWGVIEEADQEPAGRRKVYEFTDLGHAICEAVVDNDSETVDDVQSLSEQVEAQQETIQELEAELKELRKDYDEMDDVLDSVENFLKKQSA